MPRDSSTPLGKTLLALSTFPDAETARRISNQLITEKLSACANILPAVESIYRWKDKIESGNETLVFFKLSEDRQSAFHEKLRSLHPYDVPEIIFLPVSSGLPEYLRWVAENCGE
jgi:periplasmic divalent cation tolerance protein